MMARREVVSIELRGRDDVEALLARFRTPELEVRMRRAMEMTTAKVLLDAATDAPRDTGVGSGGISMDVWGEGADIWGSVFSPDIHMMVREYGRRPGQPPPPKGALLSWMKRHGIEEEAEDALRWGISIKGSPPSPFMRPALLANVDYALHALARALLEDAA